MANTIRSTGVILGAAKAAVLTCTVGTQVAVNDLVVSNPTASARTISLWHYTAVDATERPVLSAFSIAPGVTPVRLLGRLALQPGDEIRASADTAGAVTMILTNGVVSAATPAAKGFSPKGTYAAATTYVTNDVVTYTNGSGVQASYVSLQDANKGNPPDTANAFWAVLAAQGPAGSANGAVIGPASATDSAIALFDNTTGKLIKDGLAKLSTLASDIWANVANRVATVAALWAAQAPVALTYAATVTPDLSTFLNATLTLTGNCTLANPTNAKAGQSGFITIAQDGTGSRTLAFGSAWKFSGGAPTASTAASAVDGISYYVENAATPIIRAAYLKAFA